MSLCTLDYKIGCLNGILKLIREHIAQGIMNCSLFDSKYFGDYSQVIDKCHDEFDRLNQLLKDWTTLFKIPYFGSPPCNTDCKTDIQLSSHYVEYFRKVAQKMNPEMSVHLVRELVAETIETISKHYHASKRERREINSKLAFFTLVKLVEKSLKFRKIK